MPAIKLPAAQIAQFVAWVEAYIAEQKSVFAGNAHPIAPEHKRMLQPFFPREVLENVRVVHGRASEPSFYPALRALGIANAPAFSQMAGITFQDVVVHSEPLSDTLLFHELVHVVQYSHLGLQGFADRYVRGFVGGGSYEEIPLEKQAYALEARFAANPRAIFSVEDDVTERIRLNQF